MIRSLPYLFAGMDFWPCSSRFFAQALFNVDGFGLVFALFHRTVLTLAVQYQPLVIFGLLDRTLTSLMFFCGAHVCMIFICKFCQCAQKASCHPIASSDSVNRTGLKSVQDGLISLSLCTLSRNVSCVINSFSQCSRDARHEVELSLSRFVESTVCQIDPGSFVAFSLLNFRRELTHFEVLLVHHAVYQSLRFYADWGCTLDFASSRLSTLLDLDAFRIDEAIC